MPRDFVCGLEESRDLADMDLETAVNRIRSLSSDSIRKAIRRAAAPLRRSLTALGRPVSGPAGDGWGTIVQQVTADLEDLNRSTECDFLAVGEKLTEFRSAAREISSDIAALNELISGEHGRRRSAALSRILELFGEMAARIEQSSHALAGVHDLSRRIRLAFSGLHETVPVFRTLCTLTRIETSRLGGVGAGFSDLADEVAPLSESVQSTLESVLEASSQLDRNVQSAVRKSSGIHARQLRELPALIAGVTNSLAVFDERQSKARETSGLQAARNAEVCEAIDNLVGSIQFHDITRQQIDHVAQALGELRSSHNGRAGRAAAPPQARAVLTLQASQLASAERLFASSIGRIDRDLEGIAARVREMAEDTRTLMGVTEDDQNSFFLEMETAFTAILDGIGSCAAAGKEIASTAADLEETIGEMRKSVAEIRGIEIQIQRIAVNATIRAAHIGAAGAALDVIAGIMQGLATDSNRNTEDVAGALEAMTGAAGSISGAADPGSGVGPGAALTGDDSDPIGGMRDALLELHSSSEASFSRVTRIAALSARLADDIGAVRSGFSAGRLLAEVVNRALGELERIGAEAVDESLDSGDAAPAHGLDDFAKHYTMQVEREVHERVAGVAAGPSPEPEPGETAEAHQDDLGDNVELF